MNADSGMEKMDIELAALSRDIVYPATPSFAPRVIDLILHQNPGQRGARAVTRHRAVWSGVLAAIAVIAMVFALSPGARAMFSPWWTSAPHSNCAGTFSGRPIQIKGIPTREFCQSGIVLTRPNRSAVAVSRAKAISLAQKRFPQSTISSAVLVTLHEQQRFPHTHAQSWAIPVVRSYNSRTGLAFDGFVVFIDSTSGRYLDQIYLVPNTASLTKPRVRYSAVSFTDEKHGFIVQTVGDTNYLVITSDGGHTWARRGLPTGEQLIQFANARDGWVVVRLRCELSFCPNYLFRTKNGGLTWQRVAALGTSIHVGPTQMQFVSATEGWIHFGGTSAKMIQTMDGGFSWHRAHWPFTTSVTWQFLNAHFGWAIEAASSGLPSGRAVTCPYYQLYFTPNDGRSWVKRPAHPGCYSIPSFSNTRDGWMLVDPLEDGVGTGLFEGTSNCDHGTGRCPQALLRTVNGGRSWYTVQNVAKDVSPPYWPGGWVAGLQQPQFTDSRHGWMVTNGDGGGAPPPPPLTAAEHHGGVTVTSDGGRTWRLHTFKTTDPIFLAPVSNREAWVTINNTADNGPSYVLHTTDHGRHWKPVKLPR